MSPAQYLPPRLLTSVDLSSPYFNPPNYLSTHLTPVKGHIMTRLFSTPRSRNDVVHTSRFHKAHSHSNNLPNSQLYVNLHHERTFEGRAKCLVRTCCCCRRDAQAELWDDRWKWGSSNVTGKVDEVVHDGQAQVKSNKVRIPVSSLSCP
jgi:hypothetical protein